MKKYVVVSVGPGSTPSQLCEKYPNTDVYKVVARGEMGELNRLAALLNGIEGSA